MSDEVTILVVDDEEGVRKLLEAILTEWGYKVLLAGDAEEALKVAAEHDFQVSLVDKNLPGMDGIELIRKLAEARPDSLSAVITGYGTVRSSLDALEAGVVRYLLKPFEDIAVVTRTIGEILAERSKRLEVRKSMDGAGAGDGAGQQDGVRVIVADSKDDDRKALAEALTKAGCVVSEATCAQEALLKLGQQSYEVLVVEYDMGDMTADDVLLRVKRVWPDIAVVVTAASPTLNMTTSLIRRGAAGFIEKPFKDASRTVQSIVRQGKAVRLRAAPDAVEGSTPAT